MPCWERLEALHLRSRSSDGRYGRRFGVILNPVDHFVPSSAAFSHLPLEGGGRRSVVRREPGGGEICFTPPRQLARCSLPTLPLQGRVKRARRSAANQSSGFGVTYQEIGFRRRCDRRRLMRRANDRGPARWPTTLSRWRAAGALLVVASAMLMRSTSAATAAHALLLEIDGAIGPAIADYVGREFRWLNPADTRIVILRMNTPGGSANRPCPSSGRLRIL